MALMKVRGTFCRRHGNHYGVAAINVFNYETVKWAAEAAKRERIPLIIQLYPGFESYISLHHVAAFAKEFAENADVPIAGASRPLASYEIAVRGIKAGFRPSWWTAPARPYAENVEMTKAVVQTASVFDVDVEAELGHVGSGASLDDIVNSDNYTNVEQAVEFVEKRAAARWPSRSATRTARMSRRRTSISTASKSCALRCRCRSCCTAAPISRTSSFRKACASA